DLASNTGHTEVPTRERKTKSIPAALVPGYRGVDAHLWSRVADCAAWTHMATRPAARQHARNGHARQRGHGHERHGPKHGGHGRPHVHDPATAKAARRPRESKSRRGRNEGHYRALQGLPKSFARRICHREPKTQAPPVSLHHPSQYAGS